MEKFSIVGAGLVGSLLSIYLTKKGCKVEMYERRPDLRKGGNYGGRSINLALSDRGWKALKDAGLTEEISKIAIPMKGRMVHDIQGNLSFHAYGKENQAIYSVSRADLNYKLMDLAEEKGVKIHFDHRCDDVDLNTNVLHFKDTKNNLSKEVKADKIFSADGAFSAVRYKMQFLNRFDYSQEYIHHGYKELCIPAGENGEFLMDKNSLHIWPRGYFMMIALPNPDGSFTCTLFLPFEHEEWSFEKLKTKEEFSAFFNAVFPDAVPLMPTLLEDFEQNPNASLVMTKCEPWNYEDKILLLGDAAHAIVPFYGQGMNCGFEDCTVLDQIIDKYNGDWKKIFPEFAKERKPDADAICELALRNFIEMRDLVADAKFILRKKIENKFASKHPDKWMPLYSMVTFSHIPYSKALAEGIRQDKIMEQILQLPNIDNIWDSDFVESEILKLI